MNDFALKTKDCKYYIDLTNQIISKENDTIFIIYYKTSNLDTLKMGEYAIFNLQNNKQFKIGPILYVEKYTYMLETKNSIYNINTYTKTAVNEKTKEEFKFTELTIETSPRNVMIFYLPNNRKKITSSIKNLIEYRHINNIVFEHNPTITLQTTSNIYKIDTLNNTVFNTNLKKILHYKNFECSEKARFELENGEIYETSLLLSAPKYQKEIIDENYESKNSAYFYDFFN